MNKFILWIILSLFTILSAYAQLRFDPEKDLFFEIIDDGRAVKIIRCAGTNAEVRIPPRIQNLPVTTIGNGALARSHLIGVTIGNSVTHIGDFAFGGNQLTSVTIPNSVTHIGDTAFLDNQLTSVIIPNSVMYIGRSAFRENQLTSITIGDNVNIEIAAFRDNLLASITIGANVVLHEEYIVFDRELDDFLRDNKVRAGTYTFNNGSWSFSFN